MKIKLLRQLYCMSRIIFHGLVIQLIISGILLASDSKAQLDNKSIENINVSIRVDKTPLKEVLKRIEENTGFTFTYNGNAINEKQQITVSIRNGSLADLLREISRETHLKFRRINDYIHIAVKDEVDSPLEEQYNASQAQTIHGKVISSEDQSGLPGVNVIVKGTSQGTVTDVNGEYQINVPDVNAVLVFSSVGYVSDEVTVGNQTEINITLVSDIKALSEIVVVGYGSVKKSDLTGAVSSVSGETMTKFPSTSLEQGLQGHAAGVQVTQTDAAPGGAMSIRIRGGNSITGNNEPLYVIDGYPILNDPIETTGQSGGTATPGMKKGPVIYVKSK